MRELGQPDPRSLIFGFGRHGDGHPIGIPVAGQSSAGRAEGGRTGPVGVGTGNTPQGWSGRSVPAQIVGFELDANREAEEDAVSRRALAHRQEVAGAFMARLDGVEVPRHFGDPAAEYRAAMGGLAVVDRSHRASLEIKGREPAQMLNGLVTNRVPALPERLPSGLLAGKGAYAALLNPKGRMLSDLRIFSRGTSEEEHLLLDLPGSSSETVLSHLGKHLPPRLARVEDRSAEVAMLTVIGPGAAEAVSGTALGSLATGSELGVLAVDEFRAVEQGPAGPVLAVRAGDVCPAAFDLIADAEMALTLWDALLGLGAVPAGHAVFETLRIEAGQPAYGRDMDETTLPPEAGIDLRAIDDAKGCYTGQEVMVRVRDRGHVNWSLRGLLLGAAPAPSPGTPLFLEGSTRSVGRTTSEAQSPRFRQTVALGYVRRELDPPLRLLLGTPDGRPVEVRALSQEGWLLLPGDLEGPDM